MQKLSSSDEDISHCEEGEKESDPKLETDEILAKYKDLVKKKSMEFSNVEASTSFGVTSVVSKQKSVRSDFKVTEQDININCKIALHSNTTNDIEKTKESTAIDASEMDISSTDNIKKISEQLEIEAIEESEKNSEQKIKTCEEKQLNKRKLLQEITEGENSSNEGEFNSHIEEEHTSSIPNK